MRGVRTLVTRAQVIGALKRLKDPHTGADIFESGFVETLKVRGGRVSFAMRPPDDERFCPQYVPLAVEAKRAILALPGVKRVDATLEGHVQSRAVNEALKKLDEHIEKAKAGGHSA